jgi:hypothetical protein
LFYILFKISPHLTKKGGDMMKILIFLLLILFITACAQTRYTHSTKDAQEFERAKYECEKIAKHQAKESGSPDNPFMVADKTDQCLQLSGWTPVK